MQCNYLSRLILPTNTFIEITLTRGKIFMDLPMVTSEMTCVWWTATVFVGRITEIFWTPLSCFRILSTNATSDAQHKPNTSKQLFFNSSAIFYVSAISKEEEENKYVSLITQMGQSQNIRIASKTNQIEEKEKEGNLNKRVTKLKHAEKESKAETKLIEEALLSFGLLKKID